MHSKIISLVLSLLILISSNLVYLFSSPRSVSAAIPFTSAYATMSNSRLSYKAQVNAAISNSTQAVVKSTGSLDTETKNLFPNDTICFNGSSSNGCIGATRTVSSIADDTNFLFSSAVTTGGGDYIVASQTARLTVTFTPATAVASGGFIRVKIPAATSDHTNSIPDTTGFDANKLTTGNINSYITPTSFTKSATTLTTAANYHTILMTLSSALSAGSEYSFIIGDASDTTFRFINPSSDMSTHTRGNAVTYGIVVQTETSTSLVLDQLTLKVAPIDGVFVSANVEQYITYTINDASNGYSGDIPITTDVTQCRGSGSWTTTTASTATTVPFGSISSMDAFYKVAQSHYILTNAEAGFSLTVVADGTMSKDGGGVTTIPHTTCDAGTCTDTSPGAWITATNNGLGYTLGNITGTEASFTYSSGYKPFSTTAREIMSKASKTSGSRIAVCYQLSVDPTQDTGYYFNKLTYVATPKF